MLYGAADLWRTTNPSGSPANWEQVTHVGEKVSAIAVAPSNPQVVYVGFANGVIEVSTNGGETFEPIAAQPFSEPFVTGISVNPANPKEIAASFSFDYVRKLPGLPHVALYSYTSTPAGGTWSVITGNLPAFAVSKVAYWDGALAAATDEGVYATAAPAGASTEWTRLGSGLPNVQVQDLYVGSDGLYAVTHGRGAWKLPNPIRLPINVCGPPCFIPVYGEAYPPDQPVRGLFDGAEIASTVTSPQGRFKISVQVPAGAVPGEHTISVLDSLGVGGSASFLARTDWLSARFDPGQSGFDPELNALSAASVGSLTQAADPQWGGFVSSAPIYAAGDAYVGSSDGTVRAFDPTSARQLWSFPSGSLPPAGAFDGSPAAVPASPSSPSNKGCAIIAGSANGTVYGLDPASGAELWSFDASAPVTTSPVVVGERLPGSKTTSYRLIVTTSAASVDELDACTGALLWSQTASVGGSVSPAQTPAVLSAVRLADGSRHTVVTVALTGGGVEALDAANGTLLWSLATPGPLAAPAAFTAKGLGARVALESGSTVQELSAATGRLLWSTDTHTPLDGGVAVQREAGAVPAGTVFAVDEDGGVHALEGRKGALLWSTAPSGTPSVRSAPTLANGVLYFTTAPSTATGAQGTIQALDATDGAPLFSADLGGLGTGQLEAGPALADGSLLVGDFTGGIRIFSLPAAGGGAAG